MALTVRHDEEAGRFHAAVEGREAEIRYRRAGSGTLDLVSTHVPEDLRGRGIAGALAEGVFGWARERGQRLILTCPYLRAWLERHPEQRDVVVEG